MEMLTPVAGFCLAIVGLCVVLPLIMWYAGRMKKDANKPLK